MTAQWTGYLPSMREALGSILDVEKREREQWEAKHDWSCLQSSAWEPEAGEF